MYKKAFFLCLIVLCSFSVSHSQYNIIKNNSVPFSSQTRNVTKNTMTPNPGTTGFAYYLVGTTQSQLFKFSVADPNSITLIGGAKACIFVNGDFANPTGIWKFYVQQYASPFSIWEVDTGNSSITQLGTPINMKSGHTPTDMEWDPTTNTMYMVSCNTSLTETQFYSLYWPTMTLTWIGSSVTVPGSILAGGFNANGTYFGIDALTDALWKVNKLTGEWTEVGPLGYPVAYTQDAGFDRSDYSKMLWCACGGTHGLYEVDTATGTATLIGPFPSSASEVMAVGFVSSPGPHIIHTPLQNTNNVTGPYVVNASIIPNGSGIATAKIYWSRNNPTVTDSTNMTNSSGNNWTANFPGNGQTATYRYYIKAEDSLNRAVAAPFNAPSTLYTFLAIVNDTSKPVITHIPLSDIYKFQWPDTINATVTDNYGIDSVWVSWRINSNSTKHLKLSNPIGNVYTSVFNSLNSDVNIGDTIYYRIIAQDNSPNHNKDSTNLISFKIIPSDYTCIGNGNVQLTYQSPFNAFENSFVSQMLWTASEIFSNGGMTGNILKIGFNVLTANPIPLNGFTIKMQNTSLTILNSGYVNSGWNTVYSGTYTCNATGWQYITLQIPFYWDGVSNLLVETCFGNSSYSGVSAGYVTATSITGMYYWGDRFDSLGCSVYPTPNGSSARPNVCFQITPYSGISSNNNKIPDNYLLHQNYPNPFNPVTKISYDIPERAYVTLKIYDILGREVKELVNEIKSRGSYTIDFDASGLPSGVYLYRLESNNYIMTRRMILLK